MKEIWKDVPGYEGLYRVSNLGNVRSLSRTIKTRKGKQHHKGKILTLSKNRRGYVQVPLSRKGKRVLLYVHRLVMQAFHGDSEMVVNHKDGDKSNNRLANLEYTTQKDNIAHATNELEAGAVFQTKKDNPTHHDAKNRRHVSKNRNRAKAAYDLAKMMYMADRGLDSMPFDYSDFDRWLEEKTMQVTNL